VGKEECDRFSGGLNYLTAIAIVTPIPYPCTLRLTLIWPVVSAPLLKNIPLCKCGLDLRGRMFSTSRLFLPLVPMPMSLSVFKYLLISAYLSVDVCLALSHSVSVCLSLYTSVFLSDSGLVWFHSERADCLFGSQLSNMV
jgi:hypothetical protein